MVSSMGKEWSKIGHPKVLFSSIAAVGGLALVLLLASTLLVSQPIGNENNYASLVSKSSNSNPEDESNYASVVSKSSNSSLEDENNYASVVSKSSNSSSEDENNYASVVSKSSNSSSEDENNYASVVSNSSNSSSKDENNYASVVSTSSNSSLEDENNYASVVSKSSNSSLENVVPADCDLYRGKWVYDDTGTLYTNNSCPIITQMQNCQGNGRPDKDYENWRWKPFECNLPRFDPRLFLELMRGKTLAFIGDSVARNQMESMLCILWQAEVPKNRGSRKMQRYFFRSTSTMIVRIWSSWLVHQTPEPFDFAPEGVAKLHLDAPDEVFMEHIKDFDVIVLSSGHWFAKQSVYILNNEIVGGQLWWPDKSRKMKINNIDAYGISVETILTSMGTHLNYTGLTIVRSFSPDHYEGGEWNTGGSCTGKIKPATDNDVVKNAFTNIMHEKQVAGFKRAIKKKTNKSSMALMDVTQPFQYRHDGHPGPYRSPDPNKITQRGPHGQPPPQDCLHWCMPGPIDTWNELVLAIIRGEFSNRQENSS